jgi:hypothetical protein
MQRIGKLRCQYFKKRKMKLNKKTWLLLITFPLVFICCRKNSPGNGTLHTVSLYKCGDTNPGKTSDYICFDSLITDSRCPAGGICIWYGYAVIRVSYHETGNIYQFNMSLPNDMPGMAVNDTIIKGTRIIFKKLDPYPGTTGSLDTAATFSITP